jgi:hypothetical protein
MSAAAIYKKTKFANFGNALSATFLATSAPVVEVGICTAPLAKEPADRL